MPVEILKALGVRRLRLLSNNPEKVEAVQAAGIEVVERVPAHVEAYKTTAKYLRTKREKIGATTSPHCNKPRRRAPAAGTASFAAYPPRSSFGSNCL